MILEKGHWAEVRGLEWIKRRAGGRKRTGRMPSWNQRHLSSYPEDLYIHFLLLFFWVFLLVWMCFSTKWVIAPCGDFQLWCRGYSLFCTFLSLTSRTRSIWKEDWSSSLEEISFSAHEASTFVKELMQPLGTWKPHSRDNRKLSSLRAREVASRVLLLGPGT